jgi:hypothetical protein
MLIITYVVITDHSNLFFLKQSKKTKIDARKLIFT